MKIGFIGLGIMGGRMAANLQKHGNSLVVFNCTRAKAEPLLGPVEHFLIPRQNLWNKWMWCSRRGSSGAVEQAVRRGWIFESPAAKCTLGRL